MSRAANARNLWREVLSPATSRTLAAAPWLWLAMMVPLVIDGHWSIVAVGRVTLLALPVLPVLFVIAVLAQVFRNREQDSRP